MTSEELLQKAYKIICDWQNMLIKKDVAKKFFEKLCADFNEGKQIKMFFKN